MKGNVKYMSAGKTAAKSKAVTTFIKKYLAGELKKTIKTEDVPENWDSEPVKVLVGKNFNDVALDKSKHVFVEFYAPWCEHCKSLAPIWDKLGEEFRDDDSVLIAKMDATANEVEGVNVEGYPALKMWTKGTNKVVDFNGARDFETLVQFVKTAGEMKLLTEKPNEEEKNEKDEL